MYTSIANGRPTPTVSVARVAGAVAEKLTFSSRSVYFCYKWSAMGMWAGKPAFVGGRIREA